MANSLIHICAIKYFQNLHKSSNFNFKSFKSIAMNAKILLIALSAAAFTSCSTAYKSGQTPDDVYYSPAKPAYENHDNRRIEDPKQTTVYSYEDRALRMQIRDRRWREFNDDYDYSYNNSPYYYSYYSYNNYGYYYNPYYCSRPLYYPTAYYSPAPVNTTPRMVNLNSYKNYNTAVAGNGKTYSGTNWVTPNSRQYNNSNNGGSRLGNLLRQVITPDNSSSNNSSNNNNTRTYTPSTNTGSSSSSSGSSSGGTSVPRPARGN